MATLAPERTTQQAVKKDFKMHDALLVSVIKKQAGTVDKAMLEGIMNSIDAGATRVDVTLLANRIIITDDGRGFQSEQEVDDFFATFGTPHVEGDAIYGRFRMGRGQLFAFGKNTWRTGQFQMDVDVDSRVGFDWTNDLPDSPGCNIDIKLYTELSQYQLHETIRAITKMVRFAPVPIYINDLLVTEEIDPSKYPDSTEDAYIKLNDTSVGVDVYNLGVFVENLAAWKMGCSGVIISRKQLDVNFARNQVLESCTVWKRIKPLVNKVSRTKVVRKKELTQSERENICMRLASKDCGWGDVWESKFILDVTGKPWSPLQIIRAKFPAYTVAKAGDSMGDKLMQSRQAFVVDALCMQLLELEPDSLFVNAPYSRHEAPVYTAYEKLTQYMDAECVVLPKSKWTPTETAWVRLITRMMGQMMEWESLPDGGYNRKHWRRIEIGLSDTADGWTDGRNYIAINRSFLKKFNIMRFGAPDTKSITAVLLLLCHELCHDTDSRDNVHSPDFYRAFHDLTTEKMPKAARDISQYVTPAKLKAWMKGEVAEGDDGEPDASPID